MAAKSPGPVEVRVLLHARRLTLTVRTVVAPSTACLGIVVSLRPAPAAVVAALFLAWHALLVRGVVGGRARLVAGVDLALIAAICLAQYELLPSQYWYTGAGWVVATTSIAVITAQGYLRPVSGMLFAAGVSAAFLVAAALRPDIDWRAAWPHAAWLLMEASLGRVLMDVVGRSGRRVDLEAAQEAAIRQRVTLATARRDDARYQAALLHDTVAATLTAAAARGTGWRDRRTVAAQARRDLALLELGNLDPEAPPPGGGSATGSLVERVTRAAAQSPLDVAVHSVGQLPVLPEAVVSSIVSATREALRNVERHAGVRHAMLTVAPREADGVELTVADEGHGFDPGGVTAHRTGITLSIEERMTRVGGRASVSSSSAGGTRVLLTWPDLDRAPHD